MKQIAIIVMISFLGLAIFMVSLKKVKGVKTESRMEKWKREDDSLRSLKFRL